MSKGTASNPFGNVSMSCGMRRGFRVFICDLKIRTDENGTIPVKDISINGVGLLLQENTGKMAPGSEIVFDLLLKDILILAGVKAKMMRIPESNGIAGAEFIGLTKHQEDRLHELILLAQRRRLASPLGA